MEIKAVAFDIGNTLIRYQKPLNWKSLYRPALERVAETCRIAVPENRIRQAEAVLLKYNTRENPREYEVTSDTVFREIFDLWDEPCERLDDAKRAFYGFFQAEAACFEDAAETLRFLRARGIKTGALTDVAYGMDDCFALADIRPIREFLDAVFTSAGIGFRKPGTAGYLRLLRTFGILPAQMLFVGDEEKDMTGANRAGAVSCLVNRSDKPLEYGQQITIRNLSDICAFF